MARAAFRAAIALGALACAPLGAVVGAPLGAAAEENAAAGVHDPWERLNRGTFAFNETADRWLVEPAAIAWDTVLPDALQLGIDNFFENLWITRRFLNDLLQGKPRKAGEDLGRFLLNTTFGVGGLFDPAVTNGWLPAHDEDFGQTLGVWGVPNGPYLVLPILGPSTLRDTAGIGVDAYLGPEPWLLPSYVIVARNVGDALNTRSLLIEEIRAERAAAFDFYAAARRAYLQYRDNQVRDAEGALEDDDGDDDFFDLDEE